MKTSGTLLISGGRVLAGPEGAGRPGVSDILITDGVITALGDDAAARAGGAAGTERLDASGSLVVPGLINAHYHSHDVLAKGTIEEESLETWALLALPPSFPPRSTDEIMVRTALGALECLRGGITTVQDMVTLSPFRAAHLDAVVSAYEAVGIRAVIGPQYADRPGLESRPFWADTVPAELHHLLKSFAEPDSDVDVLDHVVQRAADTEHDCRITWALAPTAPESCTDDLLRRTMDLAERHDLQVFTHFYESKSMAVHARRAYQRYGGSYVRWLESIGMVGPRVNLAHSVWLLPEEIAALRRTSTRVILNPLSNLKLKSGVPPIDELQEQGVGLALGCDNPSCSDAQNMFQAMKLTATLNAITGSERRRDQAARAFEAATTGGAAALGRDDIGRIAVGQRADLSLIDLGDPTWLPLNNAVRQLVYAESGRGVHTVIVDGEILLRDGRSTRIDEAELRARLAEVMPGFDEDYAAVRARFERVRPYLDEAARAVSRQDVGVERLLTER